MRSLILLSAALLMACEGEVTVAITDAPADEAERVVIRISALRFNAADGSGSSVNIDPPRDITISDLVGGRSANLLSGEELPAGRYSSITLTIDARSGVRDSYLELAADGGEIPLALAASADLVADGPFEIDRDETTAVTIELDLRQSLTAIDNAAGERLLDPVLRLVSDADSGAIAGQVDAALLEDEDCDNGPAHDEGNVVYLFSGRDAAVDDIDDRFPDPLTTTVVLPEPVSGVPEYRLAFLPAGDYTAALSCQGLRDDPDQDEVIEFIDVQNVRVSAGAETTLNF